MNSIEQSILFAEETLQIIIEYYNKQGVNESTLLTNEHTSFSVSEDLLDFQINLLDENEIIYMEQNQKETPAFYVSEYIKQTIEEPWFAL